MNPKHFLLLALKDSDKKSCYFRLQDLNFVHWEKDWEIGDESDRQKATFDLILKPSFEYSL